MFIYAYFVQFPIDDPVIQSFVTMVPLNKKKTEVVVCLCKKSLCVFGSNREQFVCLQKWAFTVVRYYMCRNFIKDFIFVLSARVFSLLKPNTCNNICYIYIYYNIPVPVMICNTVKYMILLKLHFLLNLYFHSNGIIFQLKS